MPIVSCISRQSRAAFRSLFLNRSLAVRSTSYNRTVQDERVREYHVLRLPASINSHLTLTGSSCQVTFSRGKKKAKKEEVKKEEDFSDEEDEDEEKFDDDVISKDYDEKTVNVNSLRYDTIMKASTPFQRAKIDEFFFKNMVRINGDRMTKKSEYIRHFDEIDIILGRNQDNPDNIDVTRVVIVEIPDIGTNSGRMKVKLRYWKKLTIENYKNDPYDSQQVFEGFTQYGIGKPEDNN